MASEQAQPQQRFAGTAVPVQPHDSAQLELIPDLPADWLDGMSGPRPLDGAGASLAS